MKLSVRFACSLVLATFFTLHSGRAEAQWMSLIPVAERSGYPQSFFDACLNMDQWPTDKTVTSELGSFAGDLNAADDATLSTCFANMRGAGLQLTIEAAPFQPVGGCGMGVDCYNLFAPVLNRLVSLGAPSIRIRLQEPLTDGRQAGWANNDIVNQTVTFLWWLRANFSVQVTSVEAYPYNSASLLNWWIPALTNACNAAGVQPPDSFEVDHDMNASGWSWPELATIRDETHSVGWTFGYIFGSPADVGYDWHTNAMHQGSAIWYFGIGPDIYTFESWELNGDPSQTVPESQSSPTTFMFTVWAFRADGLFPR